MVVARISSPCSSVSPLSTYVKLIVAVLYIFHYFSERRAAEYFSSFCFFIFSFFLSFINEHRIRRLNSTRSREPLTPQTASGRASQVEATETGAGGITLPPPPRPACKMSGIPFLQEFEQLWSIPPVKYNAQTRHNNMQRGGARSYK